MTTKVIPFTGPIEDARVRPMVFPVSGQRPRQQYTPDRRNVRLYCISCHHPGAFITESLPPGVIFLCDQFSPCGCSCSETKGELALPRLNI